ncbi:unnamed protein product [Rodentolepis nana]|uniref:Kinesin motor domain-containing protein n=1 Tax=Rodentolepis nana TaxID=102285 RepID=A0A0R3TP01_RODNA|nr:unnamed protein product [Rodentolepis nana]
MRTNDLSKRTVTNKHQGDGLTRKLDFSKPSEHTQNAYHSEPNEFTAQPQVRQRSKTEKQYERFQTQLKPLPKPRKSLLSHLTPRLEDNNLHTPSLLTDISLSPQAKPKFVDCRDSPRQQGYSHSWKYVALPTSPIIPEYNITPKDVHDVDLITNEIIGKNSIIPEPTGDYNAFSPNYGNNKIRFIETEQKIEENNLHNFLKSVDFGSDKSKIIKVLLQQKKELRKQVDALSRNYRSLLVKYECLKSYSDGCIGENLDLNNKCQSFQTEQETLESQIKILKEVNRKLLKKLDGEGDKKAALENISLEVKKMVCENEMLKASNKQLEEAFSKTIKDQESIKLENSHLKLELDRTRLESTNQQVRSDRISAENAFLRNQLDQTEKERYKASKSILEYDELRNTYENLQIDHQRLIMLYTSEAEARKELHNQLQEVNGNFRVICRFKPLEQGNKKETTYPFEFCAMDKVFVRGKSFLPTTNCQGHADLNKRHALAVKDQFFAFNRVFQNASSQEDVFEEIQPLIRSFIDGYNVCIFTYGPALSGKTYTMLGTQECPGIIQRVVSNIFGLCDQLKDIWKVEVTISMFEIYIGTIYDLLATPTTQVKLSGNGSNVKLTNAMERVTTSEESTIKWIKQGYAQRKSNSQSSRSHIIIQITLNSNNRADKQKKASSFILCDLASSDSMDEIAFDEKQHLEASFVNKSLISLYRVFDALRRRSTQTGLVIPFRDSILTHFLKPCFVGQAKCVLIITASSEQKHLERTLKALEFGQCAMQIALGRPLKNNRILSSNKATNPSG